MSDETRKKQPYELLGRFLRKTREKLVESLAEVCGAVEIDQDVLTAIEHGSVRPSEDILLLLISHFGIKESEATKLWKMAGYDHPNIAQPTPPIDQMIGGMPNVMIVPVDNRVIYTDSAQISANDYGVIINFMQGNGSLSQSSIVARMGMSRDHATSLIETLQKTLSASTHHEGPKILPAPKSKSNKKQQ